MSMDIANQIYNTLNGDSRMIELVGLSNDVQAALSALRSVETVEDLCEIYKSDVKAGEMSVRNLIAVLDSRLQVNFHYASA